MSPANNVIHIVTGATGFLGGNFLKELTLRRPSDNAVCIVRGESGEDARARLVGKLTDIGSGLGANVTVVNGDLNSPDAGCDAQLIERLRATTVYVWHIAASLNWERGKQELIHQTNVEGTRNILAFARKIGASHFNYVSTAYTCGKRNGDIAEDMPRDIAQAANFYEASKIQAEAVVLDTCQSHDMPYTIMRPGIIVGSSTTFDACGSYTGLYGFIRELRRFGRSLGDSSEIVRIYSKLDARLAFVPVDVVIEDMFHCLDNIGNDTYRGRAIHMVPDLGPQACQIRDVFHRTLSNLGLLDKIVVTDQPVEDMTVLEKVLDRKLEFYSSYIRSEKQFRTSMPHRTPVTQEMIYHYIDNETALAQQ